MTRVPPPDIAVVRTMRMSTDLMHAVDDNDDRAAIRIMREINNAGKLFGLLTTWSLIAAELGPVRLPGGDLLLDDNGDPPTVAHVSSDVPDEPWTRAIDATFRAALHRDGPMLFTTIKATLESELRLGAGGHLPSYVASVAESAVAAIMSGKPSPDGVALLHVIGAYADTRERWSVAGVVYRAGAATLTALDTGELYEQIVEPEAERLSLLTSGERAQALSVAVRAYGDLLGEAPPGYAWGREVPPPHGGASREARAYAYALRLATAYRSGDLGRYGKAVDEIGHAGIGLALLGLCSGLALKCRLYWGVDLSERPFDG